ncbi:MerR family transcriptional regulator [Saccharopolyspora griseoalba]|uniref:MerR family transcriptional regulator n=1 Tax=Saccharopolyspora griseoalba TaxID=1431848 RepID=A0ABW2LPI2_9PSEU
MSELSERSGTPVPTIKYYQREGMLPPGEPVGTTRTRYDGTHVARLRLIRALVDVAGLSLDQVRGVLAVIDDETTDRTAAIASAHRLLSPPPNEPPSEEARRRVTRLMDGRSWLGAREEAHALSLAAAIDRLERSGQPLPDSALEEYADAATEIAEVDLAALGGELRDAPDATTYVVLGTLLVDPVLVALRRMAQEDLARRSRGEADS